LKRAKNKPTDMFAGQRGWVHNDLACSIRAVALWSISCSGFWAAALELVVIETFGVREYKRFSSWDVTPVADTVPKIMH